MKGLIKECVKLKQDGVDYFQIKLMLKNEHNFSENEIALMINRVDDEVLHWQNYKTEKSRAINILIIGVLLFVGATVLSLGSIIVEGSPVYLLVYGPIGVGVMMIITAVFNLKKLRKYAE